MNRRSFHLPVTLFTLLIISIFHGSALAASSFYDVTDDQLYSPYIQKLYDAHLITGDTDNGKETFHFRPKDSLTRAEFTKVAVGVKLAEKYGVKEDWQSKSTYEITETVLKDKLLYFHGCSNADLPNCTSLCSADICGVCNVCQIIGEKPFTDVAVKARDCEEQGVCTPWYSEYIYYALRKGMVKGYREGSSYAFHPSDPILRIHALKLVMANDGAVDPEADERYRRLSQTAKSRGSYYPKCLSGAEDFILTQNGGGADAEKLLKYALLADKLDFFGNTCQVFNEKGARTPEAKATFLHSPITRQEVARYFVLSTSYSPLQYSAANDPTVEEMASEITDLDTPAEDEDPSLANPDLQLAKEPVNEPNTEPVNIDPAKAEMTIKQLAALSGQGRCCRSMDLYPDSNCKIITYRSYSISEEGDYNWLTYNGPIWHLATNSWDTCYVPYPDIYNGYTPPPPTSDYEILRRMMQRRNEIFGNLDAYYMSGHTYEQTKAYGLGEGPKPSNEIDDVNDWFTLRRSRESEIYQNLEAYYRAGHNLSQTVEYGYSADKLPIENHWVIKWYERKKAELEAIAARQRAAAYRQWQAAQAAQATQAAQPDYGMFNPFVDVFKPFMPVIAPIYDIYAAPTVNKYADITVDAIIYNVEQQRFKNDFPSIATADYYGNNKDVQIVENSTTPAFEEAWTDFVNNKRVKGAVQLTLSSLQAVGGAAEVVLGVGIATGGTATGIAAVPAIAGGGTVAVIGADNVVAGTTGMASGFWNIVSPDESEPVDLSFSPIGATIDATTPKGSDINNTLHFGHGVLNVGVGVAGVGTALINNADDVAGLAPKLWSGFKNTFVKNVDEVPAVSNKLKPDPAATGAHTTFLQKADGTITKYETWKPNPQNPTGFDTVKRVDMTGKSHYNSVLDQKIETPHVHGKDIPGGVRSAEPSEIPNSFSK